MVSGNNIMTIQYCRSTSEIITVDENSHQSLQNWSVFERILQLEGLWLRCVIIAR